MLQSTTLDRSPFGKESHMRQITSVVEHPGSPSLHIPTHLAAADDFGEITEPMQTSSSSVPRCITHSHGLEAHL